MASDPIVYDSSTEPLRFIAEFRNIYQYRYLLRQLVIRELKVRYKRSVLGILWSLINPIFTMIILTIVFEAVFRFDIEYYSVYLLSGILFWSFYLTSTSIAMNSMVGNANVLSKVFVPPSVFVASAVGSNLINLMLSFIPLFVITLVIGVPIRLSWLATIIPVVYLIIFTFGVSLIVSTLAVFFDDIKSIWEVIMQAVFYATPIIYPISILPAWLQNLQQYNPFHVLFELFRIPLIEGTLPPVTGLVQGAVLALGSLILGWSLFTRFSHRFPFRI